MDFLGSLLDILDQIGRIRYGVPTSDKERLACSGMLPDSPSANTSDSEEADRYASGYLFGKEHPTLSTIFEPLIAQIKTSNLPYLGGSSPELQSYAIAGGNRGRLNAKPKNDILDSILMSY